MARKKNIKKTPVILRNALSVYERSITRFSDVVCQFTVQNGNQITYDVLEISANPDPTPRVERSITRFKEVVCEFVVIDGTDVHAYELEPVYVDLTGGGLTYSITNNLTNVTNSNAAVSIGDGDPYTATLTADAGYTIDSVTVTMGGVDITSSAYDSGSISIAAVSGNIVITASATISQVLPAEYQEVEYIYRSGAKPYINTNLTLTNGPVKIETKVEGSGHNNATYGDAPLIVRLNTQDGNEGVQIVFAGDGMSYTVKTGNSAGNASINYTSATDLTNVPVTIVAELNAGNSASAELSGNFNIEGVDHAASNSGTSNSNTTSPVYLFGRDSAYGASSFNGRMYSIKIWNDNVLVFNGIPCYRILDTVVGMYDLISSTFLVNSGTGGFSKGPDVN